jgi:hypothetical protein
MDEDDYEQQDNKMADSTTSLVEARQKVMQNRI